MNCHRVGSIIVCRGRRKVRTRARCAVGGCDTPHTRLCDGPGARAERTCDLKLCDRHATRTADDRDLCPFHARIAGAGGGGR